MIPRIVVRPLRGAPLVSDFLAGVPRTLDLYAQLPDSLAGYERKLAETTRRFAGRSDRERAAACLQPTSPAAARRLAEFVERGGAMVTTGQQAGLFTGPLYTIYKALTAVRLAAALGRALGVPVLPVFWVASDDHDFAEIDHADLLSPRGAGLPRRVRVRRTDPRPLPMSEMRLGADVESALQQVAETVGAEPYAEYALMPLRDAYRPGVTVAAAFRETVSAYLGGFDLLIADAGDPALKNAAAPVLAREAEAGIERIAAVQMASDRLTQRGYVPQVALAPGGSNLFHHGGRGRERVSWSDGGWATASGALAWRTPGALAEAIRREPTAFSPGVLLRPVVESFLFPTLAYVAGPGEMAYFPQSAPLFAAEGIQPPAVYPRLSATLVPPVVEEILDRLGLPPEALAEPPHELTRRLIAARVPDEVDTRLAALRDAVSTAYADLIDTLEPTDASAARAVAAARDRALLAAADVERRILRATRRAAPELTRDVETAHGALYPYGTPQERVLNIVPFLAAAGPGLLDALADNAVPRLRADSTAPPAAADEARVATPAT